jgi:alpha-beta hydrolase superfamily lysophospholipase
MSMHVRYLHGFGSGPNTQKGGDLGRRCTAAASYAIVDLEGGDFTGLTLPLMRARTLAACPAGQPVVLVGSSLGGYVAAWIAASRALPNLAGLLLIAPAFGFTARWAERLGDAGVAAWRRDGSRPFFHYGVQHDVPLGVGFLDSCAGLPELPDDPGVPTAIIHGRSDDTVDHRLSVAYAQRHPVVELHLVAGDHRLTDERHMQLIAWSLNDLISRHPPG